MFILFLLAALAIAITAAAPSMVVQIRRDREDELIHRGNQYVRAIRLFYKKFGRYPNSIKDLKDTNHLRFLRREYKDPMTESGEWILLHAADIKYVPTGFFGQKLTAGATGVGGANPGIGNTNGQPPANNASNNNQSAFGSQSAFSNISGQPNQNFVNNQSSTGGSSDKPDANGLVNGQLPGQDNSSPASGIFASTSGGQTFGGGPILGVASTSKQKSIKEIRGKDHYNDWQFFYDPRMEQLNAAAAAGVAGAQGAQPGVQQNGIGNGGFNSGFPGGTPTTQPTQPK
jgi:type II secretory pathway pseudopilin PulG